MSEIKKRIDIVQKARLSRYKEEDQIEKKDEYPNLLICSNCNLPLEKDIVDKMDNTCPNCGYHYYINPIKRLDQLMDEYEIIEFLDKDIDPLDFPGYREKKDELETDSNEAVVIAKGKINNNNVYVFVMDNKFMMGSMGIAVGERISRCFELAKDENLPVIGFCASGGARMQEGIFSLIQMANTTIALREHSDKGLFYLSILTNPTTGGVFASFASIADYIIAEPNAVIGFTGRRVIEQTIGEKLPKDFQSSEFVLEHGFIDDIVERSHLKDKISTLLKYHKVSYE